MLAFDAAICYYNGTKKQKGEIQMEKKLYKFNFEYLDGETGTVYMKLTESEKKLLEWLYRNGIIYYFSFKLIEEQQVIEF